MSPKEEILVRKTIKLTITLPSNTQTSIQMDKRFAQALIKPKQLLHLNWVENPLFL